MSSAELSFDTYPLPLEAREQVLDHFMHLQDTLRGARADRDTNAIHAYSYRRAQHMLQALLNEGGKLRRQHRDCRGTQHREALRACAIGTRWEPDDPVEIRRLQSERIANLDSKLWRYETSLRAQDGKLQAQGRRVRVQGRQIQAQGRYVRDLLDQVRVAKEALPKPLTASQVAEGSGESRVGDGTEAPPAS